jgi:hypothetical protein
MRNGLESTSNNASWDDEVWKISLDRNLRKDSQAPGTGLAGSMVAIGRGIAQQVNSVLQHPLQEV